MESYRKELAQNALTYALLLEDKEKDWRKIRDAYLVAADAAEEAGYSENGSAKSGARKMTSRCKGKVFPGEHVHTCPECHEDKECNFTCTRIYEYEDIKLLRNRLFGGYALCDDCNKVKGINE